MFKNFFLKSATFEIMWKNILEPSRTDYNIAHAHCFLIATAANSLSKYVILIAAPT